MEKLTKVTKLNHKLVAGHQAEESAVRLLLSKGYRILDRNVRYKMGELDIIATDGPVLCFIEVRSRHNQKHSDPKASVRVDKQTKLIRAATLYLKKKYGQKMPRCRFDVVGVTGYGVMQKLELIKRAFELRVEPRRRTGNPWQAY
ncbi:MAG: YraN family protein [Deltaproteobacteria bacterium]|nr:YraN family protein [Deltaproteobacteria bacterium]